MLIRCPSQGDFARQSPYHFRMLAIISAILDKCVMGVRTFEFPIAQNKVRGTKFARVSFSALVMRLTFSDAE